MQTVANSRGTPIQPIAPSGDERPVGGKRFAILGRNDKPVSWRQQAVGYAGAALTVVVLTLVARPLLGHLERANIVMLFLLTVLFAAVRLGRGPAVLAAFLSVVAFDVFFIPPHFTFAVADAQYLVTFAVMLIAALLTAHLAAGLSAQLAMAECRERRTHGLYEIARELSAALTPQQIAEIGESVVADGLGARCVLLLPDGAGGLATVAAGHDVAVATDTAAARRAYDQGAMIELPRGTSGGTLMFYLPLKAPMGIRGVLAVSPADDDGQLPPEQRRLVETAATLIAIALERMHYIEVAQETQLRVESERLRNSLLAAVSHDLRTPLTALVGLAESLAMTPPALSPIQTELAEAIGGEARRTSALVNNLLDMARLQAGDVRLRREWQPIEEVVGAALQARASVLTDHQIVLDLPVDLPLVHFDAVLVERVLCNLIENAAKYAPSGSRIELGARIVDGEVEVSVADDGPGLPPGGAERLFQKFTRGKEESTISGVGLGLAIARAIVDSHGGTIRAENRRDGGARFTFTLPVGEPPTVPTEMA
jgi:two-component system sensor histidine kinase KdpD